MKATILDVAREANVSTATVSRVINDNYFVNPDTKKRVLDAIKKLNYTVNLAAKGLKMNQTHVIGFVVADLLNSYFGAIASALEGYLFEHGYMMIYVGTNENVEKEKQVLKTLREHQVDGIVLLSSADREDDLKYLKNMDTPIVLVDSFEKKGKYDTVYANEKQGMQALTEYVISCGIDKILYLNGNVKVRTGYDRYLGFQEGMKRHHITVQEEDVLEGRFSNEQTKKLMKAYLKDNTLSHKGIVCANNSMAEEVLCELHGAGFSVPQDVFLASYDKVARTGLLENEIPYMECDAKSVGTKAGELILRRIQGKDEKLETINCVINRKLVEDKQK